MFYPENHRVPHSAPSRATSFTILLVISVIVIVVVALISSLLLIKNGTVYSTTQLSNNLDKNAKMLEKFNVSLNILANMNPSADPCENFYQFTCQGWQTNNAIPESLLNWDFIIAIQHSTIDNIIAMMDEPTSENDMESLKDAQEIYKLCVNRKHKTICLSTIYGLFGAAIAHKHASKTYKNDKEYNDLVNETNRIFMEIKKLFENIREFMILQLENQYIPFTDNNIDDLGICIGHPKWIFNRTRVQQVENGTEDIEWSDGHYVCGEAVSDESCDCIMLEMPSKKPALYVPDKHQVYITADIIRWFLLNWGHHKALIYGSLGYILAHEISHAFSRISQELEDESLIPTAVCLVDQYSKFGIDKLQEDDIFVDGEQTLEENFADNAALLLAFNAYKQSATRTSEITKLPGLEKYTDDQLFFLANAQTLCGSYTPEGMLYQIENQKHSPNIFRVLGVLQNSEEFAETWNCKIDSEMNPLQKCTVFPKYI